MGLDSFWRLRVNGDFVEPDKVTLPRDLKLCGGMFSGHGSGSFRGKAYNRFIENITGESLYQEVIENDVIKEMANKLEAYEGPMDTGDWPVSQEEMEDLRIMFRTYADAGCVLLGWW